MKNCSTISIGKKYQPQKGKKEFQYVSISRFGLSMKRS
jgi:hypothetical protein